MKTPSTTYASFFIALASLVGCAASFDSGVAPPQQPVEGTVSRDGVTAQQALADEEVVERISAAHCDRDQSCDLVGPGAEYRDRADCMKRTRDRVARAINPTSCPGGVGEVALNRCVTSVEDGACDMPGQVTGTTSHCKLSALCLKR